ncbi:MAG: peptide deformylase [Firmicutes bacterium]|nr:peptide deformylase [Bacillota bacterium]
MAKLKILTEENPVLRQKSKAVVRINKRLRGLARDMLETMHDAKGVGLAAPQVGVLERLIVVDVGNGPLILFNPELVFWEGQDRDSEGCLSIPGRNEYITRAWRVKVSGLNLDGRKVVVEGKGLLARALQHEIDHLNGILFIDYLEKENREP